MKMTLDELKKDCEACKKCPLWETRTNVVFGGGNTEAEVMFIGEAPGEDEDLSGLPFIGRSGKLFDKYLEKLGMHRKDFYIANMLKCRPPKNRDPKRKEQDICINYLISQINLIKPRMIVCLGRISAMRLIKADFKITKEHGVWFKGDNYKICAIYHPSLILRDPARGDEMLADLKMIKDEIENIEVK